MTRSRWLDSPLRRAADVAAAGSLLLLASPILALVAITVRIRLGAPVLFRQARAGRDGEPIEVIKFRSMSDATGPDGEPLPDEQRLGAFGRALRASSLDELPQLWCVLRGDMSLIGPRPLPTTYLDRYDAEQRRRLAATPGITGWAQVQGRNALDWPARLAADVWYVDHASPAVDLRILAHTIRSVFARSGVTADGHATMPEFLGDDDADGSPGSPPDPFAESGRPRAVSGVRVAVLEGEAVLFHEAASMVHRLGPVAGAVWVCCDGDTDVATMIDEVAAAFGADTATIAPEVQQTLDRFADQGLLVGHATPMRIHMTPEPLMADDGTEILTPPPDP